MKNVKNNIDICEVLMDHTEKKTKEKHEYVANKLKEFGEIDIYLKSGRVIRGIKSIGTWGPGLYFDEKMGAIEFFDSVNVHNIEKVERTKKTYDIHFVDDDNSNSKGMKVSKNEAINYIKEWNGSYNSYFGDYPGGIVQAVCNETGEVVYEEEIK